MATGNTSWSRLSGASGINDSLHVYEGALFTLRARNVIQPTVTVFGDMMGMEPRRITEYSSLTVNSLSEGEDQVPQIFDRTTLQTITPTRYGVPVFLTDERRNTDPQAVVADAAFEMGGAVATYVDQQIAANFSSLTGGTVGSAGGTITWSNILQAYAKLQQGNVPSPYTCVLGQGQYYHLVAAAATSSNAFVDAPMFQDELVRRYFVSSMLPDVLFAVSNNVSGNGGTAATGAMYNRLAIVYDERTPFSIEAERDPGKSGWAYYSQLRFATSTWAAARGVQILATDVVPTS